MACRFSIPKTRNGKFFPFQKLEMKNSFIPKTRNVKIASITNIGNENNPISVQQLEIDKTTSCDMSCVRQCALNTAWYIHIFHTERLPSVPTPELPCLMAGTVIYTYICMFIYI